MNINSPTDDARRRGQGGPARASRLTGGMIAALAVTVAAVGGSSTQARATTPEPSASLLLRSSNVSFTVDPAAAASTQLSGSSEALGRTVLDHALRATGASSPNARMSAMSELRSQGRSITVNVGRATGAWAEGIATVAAPSVEGAMPDGWIWFATKESGTWKVALEGEPSFHDLASRSSTLSAAERVDFVGQATGSAAHPASARTSAVTTGLQLPWAVGTYQTITQMPHNWSASKVGRAPYSSIDVAGGDHTVHAAASGTVRDMCPTTGEGWLRIIDPTYSTDYYHLNESRSTPPRTVAKNATLGTHSTRVCAGGRASGAHVHFALRTHDANNNNGAYVTFDSRRVGGWTFNTAGASSGNGSAKSSRTGNVGRKGDPFYNYSS